MRKLRSIVGILLIAAAVSALFFWELKGREILMTEKVLVAKESIEKGTAVNVGMFTVKGISKTNLLDKALTPQDINLIMGKEASQYISRNAQIVNKYFIDSGHALNDGESIFVIAPQWISMRSSSIRRGDTVDIYGSSGMGLLGTFRIAYVKDEMEREVRDAGSDNGPSNNSSSNSNNSMSKNNILDRPDSTSVIDHIEIITTYKEYEDLVDIVEGAEGTTPTALIIVQRGDQIDT